MHIFTHIHTTGTYMIPPYTFTNICTIYIYIYSYTYTPHIYTTIYIYKHITILILIKGNREV